MSAPRLPDVKFLRILAAPLILAVLLSALLALPACSVNVKKNEDGEGKKVDIDTPIGGIHVDKNADAADVGLPVYPGARQKEDKNDGDEKNANVNISAGQYGLRVVAIEYISDDAPDRVVAYYKDQLKKFGNVLECRTSHHGGDASAHYSNGKESDQLTCEGDNKGKVVELKVGTKQNQHIVSVEPAESGKGSNFGLVRVQIHGKDAA
jgi:hypothetical protein